MKSKLQIVFETQEITSTVTFFIFCVYFYLLQVATFILQKILLDETGLAYICHTYERFSHVAMILVSFTYFHSIGFTVSDRCKAFMK